MDLEEETDNGETDALCSDDLKMEQVSFAYEKEKYVLKDVDILFAKGSKTAIIGRNGSGKTTIINLLTRMYEPTSGKIMFAESSRVLSSHWTEAVIAAFEASDIRYLASEQILSLRIGLRL